jgi:hypothetical protein
VPRSHTLGVGSHGGSSAPRKVLAWLLT